MILGKLLGAIWQRVRNGFVYIWEFVHEPLGAASLVATVLVAGPDLYTMTANAVLNTKIDTQGEVEAVIQNSMHTAETDIEEYDVHTECKHQDDDCYLRFGGQDRGTCFSFEQAPLIRLAGDNSLSIILRGQYESETKRTYSLGPYLARVRCNPVPGSQAYSCSMVNLEFENFINNPPAHVSEDCNQVAKTTGNAAFAVPAVLEFYLNTYLEKRVERIETAIQDTLRDG